MSYNLHKTVFQPDKKRISLLHPWRSVPTAPYSSTLSIHAVYRLTAIDIVIHYTCNMQNDQWLDDCLVIMALSIQERGEGDLVALYYTKYNVK